MLEDNMYVEEKNLVEQNDVIDEDEQDNTINLELEFDNKLNKGAEIYTGIKKKDSQTESDINNEFNDQLKQSLSNDNSPEIEVITMQTKIPDCNDQIINQNLPNRDAEMYTDIKKKDLQTESDINNDQLNRTSLNGSPELEIIKIHNIPDCKYRTLTLKVLPPSPNNQTTVKNPVISQESPTKVLITTKPTIQKIQINPKIITIDEPQVTRPTTKPTIQKIQINPKLTIITDEHQATTKLKAIKRSNDEEHINKSNKKLQRLCVTENCENPAIEHDDWNGEYCSTKCLIQNCKNIFKKYVERKLKEKEELNAL